MENRYRQLQQKQWSMIVALTIWLTVMVLLVTYLAYGGVVGHLGHRSPHRMADEAGEIGIRLDIQIDLAPGSINQKSIHLEMATSSPSTSRHRPLERKSQYNSSTAGAELIRKTPPAEQIFPNSNNVVDIKDEEGEEEEEETRVYTTYGKDTWTAKRKLPQVLIIGVKKGGTRALLEFIRLHPDVRAVGPETHFFDRNYHKGLDWYRRQMPVSLEGQITMEKTPSYFVTKEVPRRVRNMSRDIKLLVVVRDPVTRAISDYAQTMSKRSDLKPFEELAFTNNATTGLVDTSWAAIKLGVYAKHLERWLRHFPLRQFHFVSGERLIKDPAGEMSKVQDFLRIRRIITDDHFYFNETKGFPCLKKSERNGRPKCLGRTKGRPHPNIDSAAVQRLRDFYRPFNVKFYLMTGVNFEWP